MRLGGVNALGTSGTVTTLVGVAMDLPRYRRQLVDGDGTHRRRRRRCALDTLQRLGPAGLAAHPCIGPDRVPFVLPGCAVFEAIRRVWPVGDVIVADRGLREGMLLRMMRHAAAAPPSCSTRRRIRCRLRAMLPPKKIIPSRGLGVTLKTARGPHDRIPEMARAPTERSLRAGSAGAGAAVPGGVQADGAG